MTEPKKRGLSTYMMDNPHLLVLTIIIILVGGISAINSMPRLEDPVITTRNATIITLVPGASAERVEAQVTEKIENELQEIAEIKTIESTSKAGISTVAIELADYITRENNQEVFSRVRDKLDDAARTFPPDAFEPVFDSKRGSSAFSLITALSWDGNEAIPLALIKRHAETLADRLRNIPGTELVRMYGEPEEQILVEINPVQMIDLGLTIDVIAESLRNADVKVPAGALNGNRSDFLVEVTGELDSVARIGRVPVATGPFGTIVTLGDLAVIRRTVAEPSGEIARSSQKRCIFVAARVREDKRVDQWSSLASATVEEFSASIDQTINVHNIFVQDKYISARLIELGSNLLLGGGIIFLVILFFMGWRASLIVGSALPLSASLTLFIIAMLGGKLHQMSIFGMIISLGLLIDNAIVITEEVRKNLYSGHSGRAAVTRALSHLFLPLLASTLTTILAFAPILLLPGDIGDFIGSIGGSVIIALVSSFFIAMIIIASLTGLFGAPSNFDRRLPCWLQNGIQAGGLSRFFRKFLSAAFGRPVLTLLVAVLIPIAGFGAATILEVQFFPRTDRNMFELKLWLPTSTSINHTASIAKEIEADLLQKEGITNIHWLHGESFPSVYYNLVMNQDGSSHYAQAIIETLDFHTVKRLISQIQEQLDLNYPEAQVVVRQFGQGPPSEGDVEFRVVGTNIRELQNIGEQIRLIIAEHPSILHTQVTMPRGEAKIYFVASEEETNLAGLRLADLARQLQGNLQGVIGGSVLEDVEELPVLLRFGDMKRKDFGDLRDTRFTSPSQPQSWIPLSSLGELKLGATSGGITKRDGERTNIIRGFTRNDALPIEVTRFVMDELEKRQFSLPNGYRLQVGGEQESQQDAIGNLLLYLPVLLLLTVAILILSFRRVMIAVILGLVAFLSVGVGLLATWVGGLPLSFNTILGSLGLVGLAFNSSIVVLASILADKAALGGDPEALAEQVLGSARHLISTTLTTIGSFLPLLIFVGGEFWPPLAIVLAGGVGGSTLLAMVFTPAAYRLITRMQLVLSKTS
ncbi:MAG: efflux RND transporter permease subunit [Desulfotalea sp.]